MRDWLLSKWAHLQDAAAIWDGSPMCPGFSWLKVKASICIALNRESFFMFDTDGDFIPVWASSPMAYWGFDGPSQSWQEVSVSMNGWRFCRYTTGI